MVVRASQRSDSMRERLNFERDRRVAVGWQCHDGLVVPTSDLNLERDPTFATSVEYARKHNDAENR